MPHLDTGAKAALIQSIARDTWAPLDYHLFEIVTGQSAHRASFTVRQILGVPNDLDSGKIPYGRTYIYDAPAYRCRISRCYYRHANTEGARYWWRSWSPDTTDETILDSARAELLPGAHLHGHAPPTRELSAPQLTLTLPARSTSTDRAELSDAELRCEIDRARQQLRDLEAIAADRIADHERTIALLRGAA